MTGGFNEAGAVMPRKGGGVGAWLPTPPRFNEAGAVMPRKEGASNRTGLAVRLLQ